MALTTANEEFLDAMVRHQIGLLRVAGGTSKKILEILNKAEADIRARIIARMPSTGAATAANLKKAQVLAGIIENARAKDWDKVAEILLEDMKAVAKNEPTFTANAANATSPVILQIGGLPTLAEVNKLVKTQPFEGRVLSQWSKDIKAADLKRIGDAIRVGVIQGESNAKIAGRVVGTAALKGTDGVTEISRQQATAIVRTATNHFANQARRDFLEQNTDVFQKEQFVATLDARTTPVCRANDGKTYDVGKGPIPPLHFSCRSIRVPFFDGGALGERPMRQHTEQQLVREFTNGKASSRDKLPRGKKGEFDKFSRKRIRELTGQVPASTTYQEFLSRQPKQFQIDVLGKTKQQLFAKGDLKLDRFVNRQGDELSLHELAKRERAAFVKAGLNPDLF